MSFHSQPGPFGSCEPPLVDECNASAMKNKNEPRSSPSEAKISSQDVAIIAKKHVVETATLEDCAPAHFQSLENILDPGREHQAAREEIGMTPLIQSISPSHDEERGILGLLATGHERVLHFVQGRSRKQKSTSDDSHAGIIESIADDSGKFALDAQSLASQHIVFSDQEPKKDREFMGNEPTPAAESSESSTPKNFSIQSRKTPYPSPVVLGELIMQQAIEEADGSNDIDPNKKSPQKKVRLVWKPTTRPPSLSSSRTRVSKNSRPPSSQKRGNVFGKAIKRILFRRPKMPPLRRMTLSSAYTTVSINLDSISPTLPQGGTREILVDKQIPPLMIQGLDRDFLPTEATLVPTPVRPPIILGGPLSFDEAIFTMAPSTVPTPPFSPDEVEVEQPVVVPDRTASPELILTRPLLTQDMNDISPFFKMGESFPAPPTPPLPKARIPDPNATDEIFKLPKLDTHGLLQDDNGKDTFESQKKNTLRRMSTKTATLLAFFTKPFGKRDRRDLVASVSNDTDKELARVGLEDRQLRDARRRNNLDSAYPVLSVRNNPRGAEALTAPSTVNRRTSMSVVEEARPPHKVTLSEKAIPKITDKVQKIDPKNRSSERIVVDDVEDPEPTKLITLVGGRISVAPTSPVQERGIRPLDMSPTPPSPIIRPASTIPTTVRHERKHRYNPPTPTDIPDKAAEEKENSMTVTPLPLLPLRGDKDEIAYQPSLDSDPTPPPSLATQYSTSTRGHEFDYSEESFIRKRGVTGQYKSETGTLEEEEGDDDGGRRAPFSSKATSNEVRHRSRGESLTSERSWATGRTTLDSEGSAKATVGSVETEDVYVRVGVRGGSNLQQGIENTSTTTSTTTSPSRSSTIARGASRKHGKSRESAAQQAVLVEGMIGLDVERWGLVTTSRRREKTERDNDVD